MKIPKIKKPPKYQLLAITLCLLALCFMVISIHPLVCTKLAGIFQGFSTGLLSGMVLLLIAGIKSNEQRHAQAVYTAIIICVQSLSNILSAYSTLYHETYHGKINNMTSQDLFSKVGFAYNTCLNAQKKLLNIDKEVISENVRTELTGYIDTSKKHLRDIEIMLNRGVASINENNCVEIVHKFYLLSNEANALYPKVIEEEQIAYDAKVQIDRSII